MSRRAPAPAFPPDDPSVLPGPAERWQELFGSEPPLKAQLLIARAIAWKEQVLAEGDLAPHILNDLRIIAHQLRTARLDRKADGAGPQKLTPCESCRDVKSHIMCEKGGAALGRCAPCTKLPGAISPMVPEEDGFEDAAVDVGTLSPANAANVTACKSSPGAIPVIAHRMDRSRPKQARRSPPAPLLPASSQLVPGARLVKVHKGVTHVVEIETDGMRYEGQLFASLSAVARHITGTHWNGLLFFGLRRRKTYPRGGSARG